MNSLITSPSRHSRNFGLNPTRAISAAAMAARPAEDVDQHQPVVPPTRGVGRWGAGGLSQEQGQRGSSGLTVPQQPRQATAQRASPTLGPRIDACGTSR